MLAPQTETRAALFLAPRMAIDADGVVEGYASLFGEVDQSRDMVMRGAFTATLAARGIRRIPMLFQHDPSEPIGIWLELREDDRGLFARGRLIPEVARARELISLLRERAIDGLSIGFRTVKAQIDPRSRIRRLIAVDLWEISIVTFPLLAGARVHAVKHASSQSQNGFAWAERGVPSRPAVSHARARAEIEWAKVLGGNAPCATARAKVPCARELGTCATHSPRMLRRSLSERATRHPGRIVSWRQN